MFSRTIAADSAGTPAKTEMLAGKDDGLKTAGVKAVDDGIGVKGGRIEDGAPSPIRGL
jgi:hypothetical protein